MGRHWNLRAKNFDRGSIRIFRQRVEISSELKTKLVEGNIENVLSLNVWASNKNS